MGDFIQLKYKSEALRKANHKSKEKKIILRHGHIAITNYKKKDNYEFEKSLSVWDSINFKYHLVGGYYVKEMKEFHINRGYNLKRLHMYFPDYTFEVDNDAFPYDEIHVDLYAPPKSDFQRVALTFMASQETFQNLKNYTQKMITAPPGAGKCQPDDTMIPTPDGERRLDELQPGDYVYDRYYNPTKILKIYPQSEELETYKFTFLNLDTGNVVSTRCGLDHLWLMKYHKDETIEHYVMTNSIIDGFKNHHENYFIEIPYNNTTLKLVDVEYCGLTKQRCILVQNDEHMYLTENGIPTHNTYCGVASTAFMSSRLVIIVPFTKLLEQWKESLTTFTSIKESEIMIVQGSKACEKIREGKCKDIKAFIFMTDTIASYQEHYGNLAVIDMFYETNAYVKIVDEVHRDLKTITMIDALTNFHMTYYMSATPGRTERKENWIFKELFHNVPKFGEEFEKQDEKHLNVMVKKYTFTPNSKQINQMVNPRVGLNGMIYEKVLMNASEDQRQDFNNSLQVVLNWAKGLLKKGNKIMILAQSVDFLTYLSTIVDEIFPNQWSLYHGGLSKAERKQALEKKVIIATMGTLGTGADIKGLQFLFNCATYSSHITVKQVSGRCRPMKDGTPVVYCELCNYGWLKTVKQFEKRKRYLIERSRTGSIVMIN